VLAGLRVMVAGAAGAVGSRFCEVLRAGGGLVIESDKHVPEDRFGMLQLDITDKNRVLALVREYDPDLIVNFAAAKLAVKGEDDPWDTLNVSVNGVQNLVDTGVRLIHASTCKAADPYCVYGAGKFAAERLVLNAGGTVFRFVNIPEAGPSMLTEWELLPARAPVPVTMCSRYVMSLREAVALAVWACVLPAGRYKVDAGAPVSMPDYAERVYPGRERLVIPRRRGDRVAEPACAAVETLEPTTEPFLQRIVSPND